MIQTRTCIGLDLARMHALIIGCLFGHTSIQGWALADSGEHRTVLIRRNSPLEDTTVEISSAAEIISSKDAQQESVPTLRAGPSPRNKASSRTSLEVDAGGSFSDLGDSSDIANAGAQGAAIDYNGPRVAETKIAKYIGSKYIELGFRMNTEIGKMAADGKPTGFHGRKTGRKGIGMVGNAEGFGGEMTMSLTIDYVLPGTPEEGFSLGYFVDDKESSCKNCGVNVSVFTRGATDAIALTNAARDELLADIQTTLGAGDAFFRTDVRLKNNGTKTMSNVRYMRALNPDNTVDQAGSYSTHVVRGETCDTCSLTAQSVSATSMPNDVYFTTGGKPSKIIYYSSDPAAVSSYGPDKVVPESVFDKHVYNDPPEIGIARTEDTYISMCFKADTILPGEVAHFTYFTAMDWGKSADILSKVALKDKPKGYCSSFFCPKPLLPKTRLPVTCAETECKPHECCEAAATCSSMNCSAFGDFIVRGGAALIDCLLPTCDWKDRDTCCEPECDTYDEDKCPLERTSNACRVYNSDCETACEAHKPTACPLVDPEDPEDPTPCLMEEGKCVSKGFCTTDFVCDSPTVQKAHFEPFCEGKVCTQTDCCGTPATCPATAEDSICSDDMTPNLEAISCNRTECAEEECCAKKAAGLLEDEHPDEDHGDSREHADNLIQEKDEEDDENDVEEDDNSTAGIDFTVPRLGQTSRGKFIGGKYIELGFRTNNQHGKMGTDDKPSNFNGRAGGRWRRGVGMTANAGGFGSNRALDIDFFLPGCPEEGFYVGYKKGGSTVTGKNFAQTVKVWKDGTEAKALVVATRGDLQADQEFTLAVDHTFFRNDIRITNKGSSTLTNVRFMRSHDPDNTVDQRGSYTTHQVRETCSSCPPGASAVSATSRANDNYYRANGRKPARVIYYTKDERAVATYGSWGLAPRGIYDSRVYDHPVRKGSSLTRDAFISICFKVDSLAPGATADFTYWTSLDDIPTVTSIDNIVKADVKLGLCSEYTCTGPWVKKPDLEKDVTCEGEVCRPDECCLPHAKCLSYDCKTEGSFLMIDTAGNKDCGGLECTSADLKTCCEPTCDTYDEESCPARASNTCSVYDGDCLPKCSTYSKEMCPHAPDDPCILDPSSEASPCADKGTCSTSFTCPADKVHKMHFPVYCEGLACKDQDCCGDAAKCPMSIYDNICSEPLVLKMEEFTCAKTECAEEECCQYATTSTTTTVTTTPLNTRGYIVYPFLDTGMGHSHTFLRDKAGDMEVSPDPSCGGTDTLDQCVFRYETFDRKIYVRDPALCGSNRSFGCCLKWDDVKPKVKTVDCEGGCPGTSCHWCQVELTAAENGQPESASSYTLRPQTAATCEASDQSRCLGGNKKTRIVEATTLTGAGFSYGEDRWDCRLRVSGGV